MRALFDDEKYLTIMREALSRWGYELQAHKVLEECRELEVAVERHLGGEATDPEVITEIADVIIMAYQLAYYFGADEVESEIERKMQRVHAMLNRSEQSHYE